MGIKSSALTGRRNAVGVHCGVWALFLTGSISIGALRTKTYENPGNTEAELHVLKSKLVWQVDLSPFSLG